MPGNLLIALLLAVPMVSFAQTDPLVGIPGVSGGSMSKLINALYLVAISVAALLAVVKIVIAGAKYMLSDVVTNKQDAIKDIRGALLGLLIVLAAFLILSTINPQLLELEPLEDIDQVSVNSLPQSNNPGPLPSSQIGSTVNTCQDPNGAEARNMENTCPGTVNATIDASTGCRVLECAEEPVASPTLNCSGNTCTCDASSGVGTSACVTECKLRANYISHSISGNTVTCEYQTPPTQNQQCSDVPLAQCNTMLIGSACVPPPASSVCETKVVGATTIYYGFE